MDTGAMEHGKRVKDTDRWKGMLPLILQKTRTLALANNAICVAEGWVGLTAFMPHICIHGDQGFYAKSLLPTQSWRRHR